MLNTHTPATTTKAHEVRAAPTANCVPVHADDFGMIRNNNSSSGSSAQQRGKQYSAKGMRDTLDAVCAVVLYVKFDVLFINDATLATVDRVNGSRSFRFNELK